MTKYTILALAAVFTVPAHSQEAAKSGRFDHVVRNGFFAGFMGDTAALDRSMKICEEVLAENPKHAEALVWHGSGLVFRSGQLFRAGDQKKGMELWIQGLKETDEAVALDSANVGVRIPRGAMLLNVSRFVPPEMGKPLLEKGLGDYEAVHEMQKDYLDQLGTHPKGELLFGIAEAHARLGNTEKAQSGFERIAREMPGTEYGRRAATWLEKRALAPEQTQCVGCHVN